MSVRCASPLLGSGNSWKEGSEKNRAGCTLADWRSACSCIAVQALWFDCPLKCGTLFNGNNAENFLIGMLGGLG